MSGIRMHVRNTHDKRYDFFFQTNLLKNDEWNISGDARFPTIAELGSVWSLVFLLFHLNWCYLTLNITGVGTKRTM